MNTIMEEKIKQAFQEWNEKPKSEPKQEESPKVEKISAHKHTTNILIDAIKKCPGITGKELRNHVLRVSPSTPSSHVPAILKYLFDKHYVRRVETTVGKDNQRQTFAYTALTDEERKIRKNLGIRKSRGRPKKVTTKSVVPLAPDFVAPAVERVATHPLAVGSTTMFITIRTEDGANYSLGISEAKVIYQQLNQIFGGVR